MKRLKAVVGLIVLVAFMSTAVAATTPKQISNFLSWAKFAGYVIDNENAKKMCQVFQFVLSNVAYEYGFMPENFRSVAITVGDGEPLAEALEKYFVNDGLSDASVREISGGVMMIFSDLWMRTFVTVVFVSDRDTAKAFGVSVGDGCLIWGAK